MPPVLEPELKVYAENKNHLLGTAEGKFVLIGKGRLVGVFDSKMDAIAQGYQIFGNAPFLVKQILKIDNPQDFISSLLGI